MSQSPRLLPACGYTLSRSQSIRCVTMPLLVRLRMSLTSSLAPPSPPPTPHPHTVPPTHRHTHTELSLFPICHPLLSRQQCRLSQVLVIDCYCKVGWALRYWISSDCFKPRGWLWAAAAVWVQCSLCGGGLKDLIMDSLYWAVGSLADSSHPVHIRKRACNGILLVM